LCDIGDQQWDFRYKEQYGNFQAEATLQYDPHTKELNKFDEEEDRWDCLIPPEDYEIFKEPDVVEYMCVDLTDT